jgi:hypothetical protein
LTSGESVTPPDRPEQAVRIDRIEKLALVAAAEWVLREAPNWHASMADEAERALALDALKTALGGEEKFNYAVTPPDRPDEQAVERAARALERFIEPNDEAAAVNLSATLHDAARAVLDAGSESNNEVEAKRAKWTNAFHRLERAIERHYEETGVPRVESEIDAALYAALEKVQRDVGPLAAVAEGEREDALTAPECRALRMAVIFGSPPEGHDSLTSAVEKLKRQEVASQESHGRVGEPPMKGAKGER